MALTQVTSGLISSVSNTAITGLITSSQIANVANSQVTGLGTMSIQNSNNVTITGGNVCTSYVCSTYLCGTTSANAAISCSSTCQISPIVCGTTCVLSPIVCGGTCLTAPVVCGAHYGDGSNLTGLSAIPTGTVIYSTANTPPTGYVCTGTVYSQSSYPCLFSCLGLISYGLCQNGVAPSCYISANYTSSCTYWSPVICCSCTLGQCNAAGALQTTTMLYGGNINCGGLAYFSCTNRLLMSAYCYTSCVTGVSYDSGNCGIWFCWYKQIGLGYWVDTSGGCSTFTCLCTTILPLTCVCCNLCTCVACCSGYDTTYGLISCNWWSCLKPVNCALQSCFTSFISYTYSGTMYQGMHRLVSDRKCRALAVMGHTCTGSGEFVYTYTNDGGVSVNKATNICCASFLNCSCGAPLQPIYDYNEKCDIFFMIPRTNICGSSYGTCCCMYMVPCCATQISPYSGTSIGPNAAGWNSILFSSNLVCWCAATLSMAVCDMVAGSLTTLTCCTGGSVNPCNFNLAAGLYNRCFHGVVCCYAVNGTCSYISSAGFPAHQYVTCYDPISNCVWILLSLGGSAFPVNEFAGCSFSCSLSISSGSWTAGYSMNMCCQPTLWSIDFSTNCMISYIIEGCYTLNIFNGKLNVIACCRCTGLSGGNSLEIKSYDLTNMTRTSYYSSPSQFVDSCKMGVNNYSGILKVGNSYFSTKGDVTYDGVFFGSISCVSTGPALFYNLPVINSKCCIISYFDTTYQTTYGPFGGACSCYTCWQQTCVASRCCALSCVYSAHHYNPTTQFITPPVARDIVNGVVCNCLFMNSSGLNNIKAYIKT